MLQIAADAEGGWLKIGQAPFPDFPHCEYSPVWEKPAHTILNLRNSQGWADEWRETAETADLYM